MLRRIFRRRHLYNAADCDTTDHETEERHRSRCKEKYEKRFSSYSDDESVRRPHYKDAATRNILSVREEERQADVAWKKMRSLILFYQALYDENAKTLSKDQGLRTLIDMHDDDNSIIYPELQAHSHDKVPEGMTAEMFRNLGRSLEHNTMSKEHSHSAPCTDQLLPSVSYKSSKAFKRGESRIIATSVLAKA